MIKFIKWFFKPSANNTILKNQSLIDYINQLEIRIQKLEYENIETTNTLYEIMNTLDKSDDMGYDISKFTLGK
jgi:hypothetical protein